ncbi:MAG: FAD binding domain-containing protein, partial [Flavobacteriales bacterium]|nr:FAD binding domain-containing protein [Flavobacteriales bacterium]
MVKDKTYLIPTSVHEAIEMAKANSGSFKYLAGGTDVMVNKFQGNDSSPCLIDLSKITDLKGISKTEGY